MIAKKQRLARQSAKNLIDFDHIVVDTDFGGAVSFRAMHDGRNNLVGDDDDDIVEDMASGLKSSRSGSESSDIKKDSLVR